MTDYTYRPPTKDQLNQLINYVINSPTSPFPEGAGIAISWGGESFPDGGTYCYGKLLDWHGNAIGFPDDALFKIASCSKTFTATLYAIARHEGIINEFTTIGDVIAPTRIGSKYLDIPLVSLVNYTSGFPADNGSDAGTTPNPLPVPYHAEDMFEYLQTNPFTPTGTGNRYTYSNLAFSLLGWLLTERMGGNDFAALIKERIFQQLGMIDSRYTPLCPPGGSQVVPEPPQNFPCCYSYSADSGYQQAPASSKNFNAYYGGGGVLASPRDMLRWLLFNLGLAPIPNSAALLQLLQTPTTNFSHGTFQASLGWMLTGETATAPATLYKDGDLPGANSFLLLVASDAPGSTPSPAGVSVIINVEGLIVDNTTLATWLARQVLHIMLGGEPPQLPTT